jgi:hypothetical protein
MLCFVVTVSMAHYKLHVMLAIRNLLNQIAVSVYKCDETNSQQMNRTIVEKCKEIVDLVASDKAFINKYFDYWLELNSMADKYEKDARAVKINLNYLGEMQDFEGEACVKTLFNLHNVELEKKKNNHSSGSNDAKHGSGGGGGSDSESVEEIAHEADQHRTPTTKNNSQNNNIRSAAQLLSDRPVKLLADRSALITSLASSISTAELDLFLTQLSPSLRTYAASRLAKSRINNYRTANRHP